MSEAPEMDVKVVDCRENALMVLVDKKGVADIRASIPKPEAAAMLRYIADQWDPPSR